MILLSEISTLISDKSIRVTGGSQRAKDRAHALESGSSLNIKTAAGFQRDSPTQRTRLTLQHPDYVATRIELALSRRPVMPLLALAYRLCEVGSRRLDPRHLKAQIVELVDHGQEIVRTPQGLYASPDLTIDEAHDRALVALAALRALGLSELGIPSDEPRLLIAAADVLGTHMATLGWKVRPANGDTAGAAARFMLSRGERDSALMIGVVANARWIYPDSPALWQLLADAAEAHAHPVIVARKVAPMTFPMLAHFNARALQFYDLLVQDASDQATTDALGLPRLRTAATLPAHAVTNQLLRLVAERPPSPWAPDAPDAFGAAIERGFGSGDVDPARFLTWAHECDGLPTAWVRSLDESIRQPPSRTPRRTAKPRAEPIPGYGRVTQKSRVPMRL